MLRSLLILLTFSFIGFAQAEEPTQKDVLVPVNDVYVPGGFDSETDVFVVVSGIFPNSCYTWRDAEIERQDQSNVIKVETYATVSQGMCLTVLVPYTKEVRIGRLESGTYTLLFPSSDGTYFERELVVE